MDGHEYSNVNQDDLTKDSRYKGKDGLTKDSRFNRIHLDSFNIENVALKEELGDQVYPEGTLPKIHSCSLF